MTILHKRLLIKAYRIRSYFFHLLSKTIIRDLLFQKANHKDLHSISCKSFGADMYVQSFGQYAIPGKNRIYKVSLDELSRHLLADAQPYRVLADLHAFNWIGCVGLIANKNVRQTIKQQIHFWITNFSKPHDIAWAPLVTSKRIFWWLRCFFIIKSSDKNLLDLYTSSIHAQSTYLYKIRWLYSDIEWTSSVFSTLLLYALMSENHKMFKSLSNELTIALNNGTTNIDEMSTVTILSILVNLLNIASFIKTQPETLTLAIHKLHSTLCTINTEAGLCMFNSLYTPNRQYVNSVLANIPHVSNATKNDRFIRQSAFDSDLVIDTNDKWLTFEFHFANQLASVSNRTVFVASKSRNSLCSSLHKCEVDEERGYFLFSGNSSHKYTVGNISFSRRIYMNNLGTELRGEDVVSGLVEGSFIIEFIISDRATVSHFTYQNGLNIEFAGGKKWIMLLSPNVSLTSTKENGKIINGTEIEVSVIRLEANKTIDQDCVCKWSLKEV